MKKTLFLILALCTLSTGMWGAVTKIEASIAAIATDSGWSQTTTSYHPYLQLDENVSVKATGTSNGTHSNSQWYIYMADNNGKFSISANNGYWIESIAFLNNAQNGAVIKKVGTSDVIDNNESPYTVNSQSINLFVDETTSTTKAKNARIKKITVTYDVAPTGISLNVPAAMNATVGNKFQIIATVAPSTTVFQAVKWTTSNASAVDVDQNGIIDVKGAGQATITATTVNGKTATCVIDAAATTDESFEESFGEYGTYDFTTTTKTKVLTYGLSWSLKSSQRNSSDMVGSNQGIELRKNTSANNYIAYTNAQQEGGVKRVAFQWRAVDGTKQVAFAVDSTKGSIINPVKLPANGGFDQVQQYSRDINFDRNMQFRILVTTANTSDIVYGPLTITPYLLYKTKEAEATGTYKNEDLINNTGATPTFTLEDNDGEASIADDGTVTCLKEGEVTVKASWNGGKVYTTYTLTTHVKPIPDITFGNTIIDAFGSYTPAPVAKLGDVTIEDAQWTYTSSNAAVATVNEGVFTITGAGTSTITATIVAGETYASTSATATLTVNEPTVGVWIETFDSLEATTGYNEAKEVHPFDGRNHVYNWQVRNYQFTKADGDKVNGKNGIRIKYSSDNNNYIATAEPYEGGVQALYFNWRLPGSGTVTTDYTVSISGGNIPYSNTVQKSVKAGTGQYYTFVETLNNKSNGMLRFKVNKDAPSTIFSPVTIKPYLLYTRKDTSIKAMDYETAAFKYTNKDTIDNTNGEGVISYAIEDAANKADIATIDAETGEVTIVGDGTVKVIAKWKHDPVNSPLDSVTTSYNLTILLRKHGVKFEHKDTTIYLKDGGSYTQEVTKACASAVPVYSFEGEYGTCGINSATGEVTFTEPDTVVVKATVPQVLPYKGGSATYTLRINRSDIDPATLSFQIADNPVEKNIDDAPFTNELTDVPAGCGDVKYSTNKPSVAIVNENTGEVTIKGAGDATITATVLQGTIYNQVTKTYQISVDGTSENKTITETFKKYERSGSGWGSSVNPAAEREGDYFDWNVYLARHDSTADRDYLYGNAERATWLSNGGGYIESKEAVEGGIKRINFKWNKYQGGTRTVSFSVIVDGVADNVSEELVTESGVGQRNPDAEYSHNFLSKKNSTLKFLNTGNTNMEIGEITITPYIYFPKRCDTIIAAEYIGKHSYAAFATYDNTDGDGTITYDSDNKEVAEVNNNGIVTIKAASATPVKITMIWQPSDQVETVTASYLLLVSDKQDRQAEFAENDVTVARGEVVTNNLTIHTVSGDVPATPTYTLESADTCVAKVIDGEVHAIAPGNTVITAHIDATSKCKALDVSYTLHVNYTPTGQYWFETLKNIQGGAGDKATTEAVNGEDGIANKWKVTNVFHKDQINGKTGTRVRYSSSIATNEGVTLEGGIKEVLFSWRVFNNAFPTHFTVTAGSKPYEYRHGILASADDVQPFAHDFNVKSNVALSISNAADETPNSQSHIIIDSIKVIPYLYYTRKDTTLVASEMGGVYTYSNNKLINNTEDAVADNFSYTVRAKDNAVSIADSHSDQITIIGAGTDTIQAAWDGVTTTYVVHVELEDAALDFAEKTPVVLLGTGSYTQTASKSTTADVKYEFEEGYDHGTATINASTGEVIFNGQTGEFHILASVPVALPYNLDSARYVLTVNNKPTPTVVFDPKTVDMNAAAFTPEAKTIPSSGMGTASYESSNEEVAKIEEGKVTIVGEGTSTISVHYEEGTEWGEADADFLLTVEDVLYEDSIKENFANDDNWQKACTTEIDIDGLFGWKTYLTRHRSTGDNKDVLTSGEQATWFNNSGNAYLKSANAIEGGIKRVAFNWKKETATAPSFTVKVDNEPIVVDATDRTGIDQRFNHNYFVKKNVVLEIDNNTASLLRVGAIKITPYLYYETKKCTLDLKVKDNFKNEDLIDNRDDKAASSINYSIIAGNEGSIAEIAADGTVTATAGGEITVQAQWSTNTSVTTTYTLTILPSKTTINLMRNDGTEDKDVIENNIGEVMPEFTLPTRDNYRFNAYFKTSDGKTRFTRTTVEGSTGWQKNIENYTDDNRKWIYEGNDAVTLYAQWKPVRKIALDNQDAATPDTVYTAICPNNNTVNLLDNVTVPEKTDKVFLGYFTATESGTQIVDANGAFIGGVDGYTDTEANFKKWLKDVEITTLYAHWKEAVVLDENNTALAGVIEENDGETVSVLLKRNLKSAYYNTICLPFALDAEQVVAAFGEGTKIAEMVSTQGVASDPEAIDIMFEFRSAMAAGIPYLIKPANDVESVLIEDVTISKTFTNLTKGNATMTCVVSKTTEMMVSGKYFLAKNDILAYYTDEAITSVAQTVLGMRAYFTFSSAAAPKRARCVFGHGVTTDVENVPGETKVDEPQKVFINGNLYIIREGKTYDAQGRLVK